MLATLLNFLAFAVILQAIVVFGEILYNLKNPFSLKLILLTLVFCICWRSAGTIYTSYYGYNRWMIETPAVITGATSVFLFSHIYQNKTRVIIQVFSLVLVLTHLVIILYYTFFEPVAINVYLKSLKGSGILVKALRIFFMLSVYLISVIIFFKICKRYNNSNQYFLKIRKWTFSLICVFLVLCINSVVNSTMQSNTKTFEFIILICYYSISVIFLFRPKFLNRTNLKMSLSDLFTIKSSISIDENTFDQVFFKNTFFIDKNASPENLRNALNMNADELNNYIFSHYGLSVNEFINKNRITYFIDLVNTGNYTNYTVDALAQEAGFNSRFHLYKSFKQFHGGTPSDYIASIIS